MEVTKDRTELIDCGACKACCRGEMIQLQPDDKPDLYLLKERSVSPVTGKDGWRLKHKPGSRDCAYLGENGCAIYSYRPVICRSFTCAGMVRKLRMRMPARVIDEALAGGGIDRDVWNAGLERVGR